MICRVLACRVLRLAASMVVKLPWVGRWQLVASQAAEQRLQDQLRAYKAEVGYLRDTLAAAQKDSMESRTMVADWLAQRVFGEKIYGSNAPALPAEALDATLLEQIGQRRRSGRDVVRQMESEFTKAYQARLAEESEKLRLAQGA